MSSASVSQSKVDAEDALPCAALLDRRRGFGRAYLLRVGGLAESRSFAVIRFVRDSRAALRRASSARLFFPGRGSECRNRDLHAEELAGVITETESM